MAAGSGQVARGEKKAAGPRWIASLLLGLGARLRRLRNASTLTRTRRTSGVPREAPLLRFVGWLSPSSLGIEGIEGSMHAALKRGTTHSSLFRFPDWRRLGFKMVHPDR